MMPCERPEAPPFLVEKGSDWTAAWLSRRATGGTFSWPRHEGQPANRALQPPLMAMTAEHCAYCDGFPIDETGIPSIDHFRPKSSFPALAFAWDNLFPACQRCQGAKLERFDADLLRPDAPDFAFARYFLVDYDTGLLRANPGASADDQHRAELTIELFGLNEGRRPTMRWRELRRPSDEPDRPYRYLFA
jgi:uncharacterized protein (TIGR02646 family)